MKTILLAMLLAASAPAREVIATGYCNEGATGCRRCCGKWARFNRTASGNRPVAGITAAGPRWVPFGTRVWIEGVGWRVVQDRLNRKYEGRWEVFFSTHREAKQFGKRKLQIKP
jgi:3D (Asp-Asp-Asp) domain-containing protein